MRKGEETEKRGGCKPSGKCAAPACSAPHVTATLPVLVLSALKAKPIWLGGQGAAASASNQGDAGVTISWPLLFSKKDGAFSLVLSFLTFIKTRQRSLYLPATRGCWWKTRRHSPGWHRLRLLSSLSCTVMQLSAQRSCKGAGTDAGQLWLSWQACGCTRMHMDASRFKQMQVDACGCYTNEPCMPHAAAGAWPSDLGVV